MITLKVGDFCVNKEGTTYLVVKEESKGYFYLNIVIERMFLNSNYDLLYTENGKWCHGRIRENVSREYSIVKNLGPEITNPEELL